MKRGWWAVAAVLALVVSNAAEAKTTRPHKARAWHPVYHNHRLGARTAPPKYKIIKTCVTASCFKKHPSGHFVPHHLKDSQ